jgi:predicted 2-oxoglutarate/Fe(II)-dependent dioxygenase YbiX
MQKRSLTPSIFVVENVYSREECQAWIAFSETHVYEAAPIAQVVVAPDVRNNTRVVLDDVPRAAAIFERLAPHLPVELEAGWRLCGFNERLRFYRYEAGQRFAWHNDGVFYRSLDEWSRFTLMIYLNDDFEGGNTIFQVESVPDGLLRVAPRAGMALLFRHDEVLLHTGDLVTRGKKYVLRTDVMYCLE